MRGEKQIYDMDEIELMEELRVTDPQVTRLCEDLLDVLVKKSLLRLEELPFETISKLKYRKRLRNRLEEMKLRKFRSVAEDKASKGVLDAETV